MDKIYIKRKKGGAPGEDRQETWDKAPLAVGGHTLQGLADLPSAFGPIFQ